MARERVKYDLNEEIRAVVSPRGFSLAWTDSYSKLDKWLRRNRQDRLVELLEVSHRGKRLEFVEASVWLSPFRNSIPEKPFPVALQYLEGIGLGRLEVESDRHRWLAALPGEAERSLALLSQQNAEILLAATACQFELARWVVQQIRGATEETVLEYLSISSRREPT